MRTQNGFTFIELMIVLALIAVIAAWAVPSFMDIVAENSVASSSNTVVGFLNEARSSAIQQGRSVFVTPVTSGSWANGMEAWVDENGDKAKTSVDKTLFVQQSFGGNLTLTGPTQLQFHPTGLLDATGGNQFKLCPNTSGIKGNLISMTAGGQVSTSSGVSCP